MLLRDALPPVSPTGHLVLKAKAERPLLAGHPWAYAGTVARVEGSPATGDPVTLATAAGDMLGVGLYHATAGVAFRLVSNNPDAHLDDAFWHGRLARALALRETFYAEAIAGGDTRHYRLAFGEADGLPGTIVDRYGSVVTVSTLSSGMDRRLPILVDALRDLVRLTAIVERNDGPLRKKDGLDERKGVVDGTYDGPVEINESGVRCEVDVLGGLKTGFFLDQRLNRLVVRRLARGRTALDVFCADGGFGLHAAAGGATAVRFVDSSAGALDRVRANAARSGLDGVPIETERADALKRLGGMVDEGQRYGLVVVDPPAFTRSRQHVSVALHAYQRVNITAMQLTDDGGILATASCSQPISGDAFTAMLRHSARKAGVRLTLLHRAGQPPDHPVLDAMPETEYLKFHVYRVDR